MIVATVTLADSRQSADNKADTGTIVGGVLGTVIIIILVVTTATCLVVVYKVFSSKRSNNYGRNQNDRQHSQCSRDPQCYRKILLVPQIGWWE
mgnify:CR=1 FL=1